MALDAAVEVCRYVYSVNMHGGGPRTQHTCVLANTTFVWIIITIGFATYAYTYVRVCIHVATSCYHISTRVLFIYAVCMCVAMFYIQYVRMI